MSRDVSRKYNYARENITFFVEEMIVYDLRRRGISLEIKRPERLQHLRTVAMFSFSPSIGDAIFITMSRSRGRVKYESEQIWNYIRTVRPYLRKEVLHCNLVVFGISAIHDNRGVESMFMFMAVVTDLCYRFCRFGHASLIGSAVSSLEFIFNKLMEGRFVRTAVDINNYALHMRILNDGVLNS